MHCISVYKDSEREKETGREGERERGREKETEIKRRGERERREKEREMTRGPQLRRGVYDKSDNQSISLDRIIFLVVCVAPFYRPQNYRNTHTQTRARSHTHTHLVQKQSPMV